MIGFKAWNLIGYTSKWRVENISIITWGTFDCRNHCVKTHSLCALGDSDSDLWVRAWSDYYRPLSGHLKTTFIGSLSEYKSGTLRLAYCTNLTFLHVQSHHKCVDHYLFSVYPHPCNGPFSLFSWFPTASFCIWNFPLSTFSFETALCLITSLGSSVFQPTASFTSCLNQVSCLVNDT